MRFLSWLCFLILFNIVNFNSTSKLNQEFAPFHKQSNFQKQFEYGALKFRQIKKRDDTHTENGIAIRHKKYPKNEKIICEPLGCEEKTDAFQKQSDAEKELSIKNMAMNEKLGFTRNNRSPQQNDIQNVTLLEEVVSSITVQPTITNRLIQDSARNLEPTKKVVFSLASASKIAELGSPEKIDEKFQKLYSSSKTRSEEERKAMEHYTKMIKETRCKEPMPVVIKVEDNYPDPHKKYYPTCTIIHQCNEQSGCCPDNKKCVPRKMQNVTLYFTVMIKLPDRKDFIRKIETLTFYNHTECKCSDLEDRLPRDATYELKRHKKFIDSNNIEKKCSCPIPFSMQITTNGICTCDCFDTEKVCLRYKRGEEYFDHAQKYCIALGECSLPTCEYGIYSKKIGRCPNHFQTVHSGGH